MTEPIPGNHNQQPDISWFAPQAVQLEHAVHNQQNTSDFSNNILWLLHDRPNNLPEVQPEQLSDVYRLVLLEEAVGAIHLTLSEPARIALSEDVVRQLATPIEELPDHAAWLKEVPDPQKEILKEALVNKFPEVEALTQRVTDDAIYSELLAPSRSTGYKEPVYPIVPELSSAVEEVSEGDGEATNAFERELAECQDAIQLRGLLEERAEKIKIEITERSEVAKKAVYEKDNFDTQVLRAAEIMINAGDLPRALSILTDKNIPEKRKAILITAIGDRLLDSAASWISGNYISLDEARNAVDGMPLPDSEKARIRSYLDAGIFRIINGDASRAREGDEIESDLQSSRAVEALKYISDSVVAEKIKEILDIKEPPALPGSVQEDAVLVDILAPTPPSTASGEEWDKWYMTTPPEKLSNGDFEIQLLVKRNKASMFLQGASLHYFDELSQRDRKAYEIVKGINTKHFVRSSDDTDPHKIFNKAFKKLDSKIPDGGSNFLAKASFAYQILSLAESMFEFAPADESFHTTCEKVTQFIGEFAANSKAVEIMREAIDMQIMELAKSTARRNHFFGQVDTGSTVAEIVKYASSDRVGRRMMQALGVDPSAETGGDMVTVR